MLTYCRLGKDRTGLMTTLVLSTCGASEDEIVSDYARCAVPSQGLRLRIYGSGFSFQRAPQVCILGFPPEVSSGCHARVSVSEVS